MIADILEISPSTARVHVHRARQTLRDRLEEEATSATSRHRRFGPDRRRPAPAGRVGRQALRRISIQLIGIDTCILWYAVDLYLDEAGDVAGITLDVWEP